MEYEFNEAINRKCLKILCDKIYQLNIDPNIDESAWVVNCYNTYNYAWVPFPTTYNIFNTY